MSPGYYNYSFHWPDSWWGRHDFLRAWRRIYTGDRRLVPPDFPALARLVHSVDDPFFTRMGSRPLYVEALPSRTSASANAGVPVMPGAYFEEPVAAAIVQADSAHGNDTAYLGLLRCANDEETLERMLGKVMEFVGEKGCSRLVGPAGPAPSWQSGALQDHFHITPPLHTPYNPPYVPELLASVMQPWLETTLYQFEVPAFTSADAEPAVVVPLDVAQLLGEMLPLFALSLDSQGAFPPLAADEAAVILRWLSAFPLAGWAAQVDGATVGFLLAQPDLAELMRLTGGGRTWLWRWYGAWRKRAHTAAGRVLLGAVSPTWQGKGIGRQLWRQVVVYAQQMGWRTLTCGPLQPDSDGAHFLIRQGALPAQRYTVYEWTPW